MCQLVIAPAEAARKDGVAGEAVGRLVHLTGANDDQLFQLCGDGTRVEDGPEMRLHRGEDFRTVRHHAEHVGYVAALGEYLVEEGGQVRGHFSAIETGYARHCGLHQGVFSWYRVVRIEGRGVFDATMSVC